MLSQGRGSWSENKKNKKNLDVLSVSPKGVFPPDRIGISILKYGILVALIGAVLPIGNRYSIRQNSRALMPNTRETNHRSVKTELYPRTDQERDLFLLTLRFCFSLEPGLIFLFWVFNRISCWFSLVSTFRNFLESPASPQEGVNLVWSE